MGVRSEPPDSLQQLGDLLCGLRVSSGMSQERLARAVEDKFNSPAGKIGMVRRWEAGQSKDYRGLVECMAVLFNLNVQGDAIMDWACRIVLACAKSQGRRLEPSFQALLEQRCGTQSRNHSHGVEEESRRQPGAD